MTAVQNVPTATARALNDVAIAYPGTEGRLVAGYIEPQTLAEYLSIGGYGAINDPDQFIDAVERAGIRGRGGASFPAATKLRAVRGSGRPTVVLANGEEGEPTSVKDRWLMRHRPHFVLDGLRLAAAAVNAATGYVYVSDPASETAIKLALAELDDANAGFEGLVLEVVRVDPAYVAGEESAAVRLINGGPALPSDKPPRVFVEGVAGLPTLVNNVETLAHMALVHRIGVEQFRAVGTDAAPGTFLMTLTTPTRTGLYEIPYGVTLREVLEWRGERTDTVAGVLVGGYFAGLLGSRALDLQLDVTAYQAAGSGLGCGAFVVLETECPVAAAAAVMSYFDHENAGQCGSCFNGTAAMAAALAQIRDQLADDETLANLQRWSEFLPGRGACRTLDGAANVAATLLAEFPDLVASHMAGTCSTCSSATALSYPPYAVTLDLEVVG